MEKERRWQICGNNLKGGRKREIYLVIPRRNFWLLSRRVVDIPPCGSFPDPFLANVPPLGVWVLVEGRGSRVEGRGSRVEGRGYKVEGRG